MRRARGTVAISRPVRALPVAACSAVVAACAVFLVAAALAQQPADSASRPPPESPGSGADDSATSGVTVRTAQDVFVATVDSIIHPVASEHLLEVLERADREGAAAVVLQLSTPGGLLTSTRQMTTAMLEARTPVIVWVAPQGAPCG